MVSIVWNISDIGRHWRMASLTTVSICILCSIPWDGCCIASDDSSESQEFASEILSQVGAYNTNALMEEFDQLDKVLETSEDPLAEGRKFLDAFIREVNAQYGLALTISEACKLVRENLHILQIPLEVQNAILATIELLERDCVPTASQKQHLGQILEKNTLTTAWIFEWLILKKHKHKNKPLKLLPPSCYANPNQDLPSNCYMGGCEMLVGALIALLPIPGAAYFGGGVILDGLRRIADGVVQLGDERRADPDYVAPPLPPGFKF